MSNTSFHTAIDDGESTLVLEDDGQEHDFGQELLFGEEQRVLEMQRVVEVQDVVEVSASQSSFSSLLSKPSSSRSNTMSSKRFTLRRRFKTSSNKTSRKRSLRCKTSRKR